MEGRNREGMANVKWEAKRKEVEVLAGMKSERNVGRKRLDLSI